MMLLEGFSPEVQNHIAANIRDAGRLIREHGKSYRDTVDSAGRICAMEAIARASGVGSASPTFVSLNEATGEYERGFNEGEWEAFANSPEVTAFAQFLLFTGRATLVHEDETYTQVISQFSDDRREDEVIEAFFACADSLEV